MTPQVIGLQTSERWNNPVYILQNRSITDIALSWGFSDPSHFGRRFKQAYGMSPRDYRPDVQKLRG